MVNSNVSGLLSCDVEVEKGETIDEGSMKFSFEKADQYLAIPTRGFYQNPSLFQIGYVLKTNRDKGILKPLKETEIGYKWNYLSDFSQYFFAHEF